jgi:hypothetical protein
MAFVERGQKLPMSGMLIRVGNFVKGYLKTLNFRNMATELGKPAAKVLVVLLSNALIRSAACLVEIHTALENNIPLILLPLEDRIHWEAAEGVSEPWPLEKCQPVLASYFPDWTKATFALNKGTVLAHLRSENYYPAPGDVVLEWSKNGGKDLLDRVVNKAVKKVGLAENEPLADVLPGNVVNEAAEISGVSTKRLEGAKGCMTTKAIFSFAYRDPDKTIVKNVYRILEERGYDMFYGPDVESGDTGFKATWTGELLKREVCICFISPKYLTSFCLEECAVAKAAPSVKRYVVLLCPKEEVLPLLENIVKKGTIPPAADLYTDLATEAVQFVCIGETDPAKIADKLHKIFVAIRKVGLTENEPLAEALPGSVVNKAAKNSGVCTRRLEGAKAKAVLKLEDQGGFLLPERYYLLVTSLPHALSSQYTLACESQPSADLYSIEWCESISLNIPAREVEVRFEIKHKGYLSDETIDSVVLSLDDIQHLVFEMEHGAELSFEKLEWTSNARPLSTGAHLILHTPYTIHHPLLTGAHLIRHTPYSICLLPTPYTIRHTPYARHPFYRCSSHTLYTIHHQ